MLQNYKNKRQEGFTIIEVLIVLAIAGLILVVVFLAVPNLQRNARNNSRKNDASRIAAAASNFVSNNNGTLPSTTANGTTILSDSGTLGQYTLTANNTPGAGNFAIVSGAQATPGTLVDNYVVLDKAAKCSTSGATSAGSTRQMALIYTIETTSSFQAVCLDI